MRFTKLVRFKKRNSFTLLEIMIALAIIALSIIPIISIPTHVAKQEIQLSRELDIDREVVARQLEAVRQLVRQEIPWEIIVSGFAQIDDTPTASAMGWQGRRRFVIQKAKPAGSRSSAQLLLLKIVHAFGPANDNAEQFFKDARLTYSLPVVLDRRPEIPLDGSAPDDGQDPDLDPDAFDPDLDMLRDDLDPNFDPMDDIDNLLEDVHGL